MRNGPVRWCNPPKNTNKIPPYARTALLHFPVHTLGLLTGPSCLRWPGPPDLPNLPGLASLGWLVCPVCLARLVCLPGGWPGLPGLRSQPGLLGQPWLAWPACLACLASISFLGRLASPASHTWLASPAHQSPVGGGGSREPLLMARDACAIWIGSRAMISRSRVSPSLLIPRDDSATFHIQACSRVTKRIYLVESCLDFGSLL